MLDPRSHPPGVDRYVAVALLLTGCVGSVEPARPAQVTLTSTSTRSSRQAAAPTPRTTEAASFGAAVAQLVPYSTDGRTMQGIRTLYALGQTGSAADAARYLAAAASLDLAAHATFEADTETLATLAQIRDLPDPRNTAALYTAIAAELRSVRSSVYARAARGLVEGVDLLQFGPSSPQGRALMLEMLRRRAPAAHLASLFYVDSVRRAVADLARPGRSRDALATLEALAADPCAAGCEGQALAALPPATRRATAAIQAAVRRTREALQAGDEDPFATLVRPSYEEAARTLARVVLPEAGGTHRGPASRVLVDVGLERVTMSLLPQVAVVDGRVEAGAVSPGDEATRTVRNLPRWGAKVVPYEPYTEAARQMRQLAARLSGTAEEEGEQVPAPPVALAVNDELEAHVLARVILSLMAAGFDDVRLRRPEAQGFSEVHLRPVAGNRIDEEQTRGRARVEVFGPFDYTGAERTFTRAASAGRPAAAQLVLFALIASRALYRALDAVRVAWPDADPDILLVLPQQVP